LQQQPASPTARAHVGRGPSSQAAGGGSQVAVAAAAVVQPQPLQAMQVGGAGHGGAGARADATLPAGGCGRAALAATCARLRRSGGPRWLRVRGSGGRAAATELSERTPAAPASQTPPSRVPPQSGYWTPGKAAFWSGVALLSVALWAWDKWGDDWWDAWRLRVRQRERARGKSFTLQVRAGALVHARCGALGRARLVGARGGRGVLWVLGAHGWRARAHLPRPCRRTWRTRCPCSWPGRWRPPVRRSARGWRPPRLWGRSRRHAPGAQAWAACWPAAAWRLRRRRRRRLASRSRRQGTAAARSLQASNRRPLAQPAGVQHSAAVVCKRWQRLAGPPDDASLGHLVTRAVWPARPHHTPRQVPRTPLRSAWLLSLVTFLALHSLHRSRLRFSV
jgi:hypothetical protein